MGFKGEYLNKFDEAGRVSLPAKMRDELKVSGFGNELVVYYTVQSSCLKILPKSEFSKIEETHKNNPPKTPEGIKAYKYIFASATDAEINGSGRITISPTHRIKANLGEECYVIGANDKIEIWNKEAWEKEVSQIEADISNTLKDAREDSGIDLSLFY